MIFRVVPVGVPIVDDLDRLDGSVGSEITLQHSFIGIASAANENLTTIFVTHCRDLERNETTKLLQRVKESVKEMKQK